MTRKEIIKEFLTQCAFGKPREAFNNYVGEDFKHHNAFFRGDKNTLINAMEESSNSSPNKIFEIKNILEDGNLVAAHSYIEQSENTEFAVVHIARFENDKIVEMWDVIQPFPEIIINENGMF